MRVTSFAVLAAVTLMAAPVVAQTSQNTQQGADSNQHSQPTNSDGTGGNGSSANPGPPGAPKITVTDSLDKQPPVATGEDLKGPPKAFPSNKAPE